jgi:hypothetical protein
MIRTLLTTALLLPAACAAAPPPPPPPPSPLDLERCGDREGTFDFLEIEPGPARQGRTLRIAASQWRGAGSYVLPPDCTKDWTLSDPSLASFSEDHTSLHIAEGATPGAILKISYRAGFGARLVSVSMPIVAKDAFVLTGRHSQKAAEGCPRLEPIGELEFTADGRFSVTWHPFETYRDYWGTYRFDAGTGALSMKVDGGNRIPGGLDLEGKARMGPDGGLVLEDMYLGDSNSGGDPPPGARSCRYTFG